MLILVLGLLFAISTAGAVIAQDQTTSETTAPGDQVTHVVTYGDTLYKIALRYGVTMDDIAKANNLTNWSHIVIGETLLIPGLTVPDNSEVVNNPLIAGTPTTHVVTYGETLNSIAQKYGLTVEDLMKSNNITNPNLIFRGQELAVWTSESVNVDASPDASSLAELTTTTSTTSIDLASQPYNPSDYDVRTAPAAQAEHIVLPGETLARIASQYGVTWQDISVANNLASPDHITVGQKLIIPSADNQGDLQNLSVADAQQGPSVIPPAPDITTGKFILVDLSDSRVYAYQDGKFLFTALGSTGLPATPTVQGQFKIYQKYASQTMSGPGYYLPGVEWISYFYQGYALHGAYWHHNWGQPMSHGCVNLRNEDAKWLYDFGDIGTPIWVQW
ncbi:MAG TPA: LysM peptidoglycan-binding domain-containing protein [Phototrophicaceae bacterium]|nr:LysM peptidoglycan-binding domain-containing protein [Phototrophicaceae bacterium]